MVRVRCYLDGDSNIAQGASWSSLIVGHGANVEDQKLDKDRMLLERFQEEVLCSFPNAFRSPAVAVKLLGSMMLAI